MSHSYHIGELAEEFGVTTRTIRFYEEKGLLAPRREGQQRCYSAADRTKLRLILRGKRFGYSLDEIAEMIGLTACSPSFTCRNSQRARRMPILPINHLDKNKTVLFV